MKTRLPNTIFIVTLLLIVPLRFITFAADVPDSMADPGKYSDDWRANGPPGGDVRSLVVDPGNPDRFYLGTLDAQIYTSADAGKSWELLYNFNKPKLFVDHIIVDPRDSKTLYVATHRHKEAGGVFKSVYRGAKKGGGAPAEKKKISLPVLPPPQTPPHRAPVAFFYFFFVLFLYYYP